MRAKTRHPCIHQSQSNYFPELCLFLKGHWSLVIQMFSSEVCLCVQTWKQDFSYGFFHVVPFYFTTDMDMDTDDV